MPKDYTKEEFKPIQDALKAVMDKCEQEDQYLRKRHIYEAKQNDLYWHGFQYIYWDAEAQEFRIPTHEVLEKLSSTREEAEFVYDYVTNIFKAHGLSIIAAIGADIPGTLFAPANADNPDDVRAAKKAEQLAEVIHKINYSKIHLLHALFILFTQHMVACEITYERDKKYGTANVPKFKKIEQQITPDFYACMSCEFGSDLPVEVCPTCQVPTKLIPGERGMVQTKVGDVQIEKGFPIFNIYGVLNVRIPSYAANQKACGYLIKYNDQHVSLLRDRYPFLRDKLASDDSDTYEKLARAPSTTQYYSESYTNNLSTLKECYFRPWQFEILDDAAQAEMLKKEFPDGAYCAFAAGNFCEALPESLDDCWDITKGDLSRTVHADPLGKSLIQIQDIRNTTSNLLLECLEHSIPTNFADPDILDFDKYSSQEIKPGLVYPAKKPPQFTNLSDGFFSFKTTTLPKEGTDLQEIIDQDAQFVSGDFPSVYGGAGEGSKTLGEYNQSRVNALRRLAIPSYFVYCWWSRFTYKAVKLYIKNMIEDEQYTTQTSDGRFTNTWIYKEYFKGKFDILIPESAGELPITFSQKRDLINQLVSLNNPEINSFLFSPENLKTVLRYGGFKELISADDIQVNKAYRVISDLLQSIPVEPDQDIDDTVIQSRIIKNFLNSDPGQDQRVQNPEGYQSCVMYLKQLKMLAMQEMQMQQQQVPQNGVNNNGSH